MTPLHIPHGINDPNFSELLLIQLELDRTLNDIYICTYTYKVQVDHVHAARGCYVDGRRALIAL